MDLIRKVAPYLHEITDRPGSKAFRKAFDEKVRANADFKQTPWIKQVMTKLKAFL